MTYQQQLDAARAYLAEHGASALNNPHGMLGWMCGCHDCFTCAAAQVLHEYRIEQRARDEAAAARLKNSINQRITL